MFLPSFYKPQLKLIVIISNKNGIKMLCHELLNNLRYTIFVKKVFPGKFQIWMGL